MPFQIPSSCLYIQLSVCVTGPRIFNELFSSLVKILFCTDQIEFIESQDLEQRQRAGDCFWIHIPHGELCDPPLSSHQTFQHEVKLRQCVFCKKPLLFWFSSSRRNFGLSGNDWKYCASSISLPFLLDVPNLSPEKCVRVHVLLWPLDYLWNPSTRMANLLTEHSRPSCHFSKIPATVHNSSELTFFLLIMCIDALESNTNFRSSGLVEVIDVDIPLTSPGIENVALSEFLSL